MPANKAETPGEPASRPASEPAAPGTPAGAAPSEPTAPSKPVAMVPSEATAAAKPEVAVSSEPKAPTGPQVVAPSEPKAPARPEVADPGAKVPSKPEVAAPSASRAPGEPAAAAPGKPDAASKSDVPGKSEAPSKSDAPSKPAPVSGSASNKSSAESAPVTPAVVDPVPVAVLQTVVEKLETPPTKAAAAPRSGYTPRVFAFDRPPKTAPGANTPDGAAAAAQAPAQPAEPAAPVGQAPAATGAGRTSDEAKTGTSAGPVPGAPAADAPRPAAAAFGAAAGAAAATAAGAGAAAARPAPADAAAAATPAAPAPARPTSARPASAGPASADAAPVAAPRTSAPETPAPRTDAPDKAAPAASAPRTTTSGAASAGAAAGAAAAGAAAGAAASAAAPATAATPAAAAATPAPAAPATPAAPPSVPPHSPAPQSGAVAPGAVPPAPPDQNSFLKPLTGAIQRVSRPLAGTRWAPVRPDAAASAASAQEPGGPQGPAGPFGPVGPNGPGTSGQGEFFGLAGDGAPSRGPKIALISVLVVVLLFAVYAFVAWGLSDKTPRETTVAGVDVGGMTQAQAAAAITEQLAPRAKEPIELTAGEGKAQLSPEPSGLAIDAEATAAELTEFSLSPVRMWEHMFGGSDEALVLAIDQKKFDAAVAGLEESLAVEPVDGTVSFVDGQAVKTDPKEGSRIVASETSRIIQERWILQQGPYDLPVEPVEPTITQQETDESLAIAQKVISAPVTVSVGGQSPVLAPDVLAGLFRFEQRDGKLVTFVDGEATVAAVVDGTHDLLEVPSDAHFEFAGGRPTVVGGKTGTTLDPADASKAVQTAATSDDRETSVELVEQDPKETVDSLKALGVKEVVSEFHTPLTNEPVRTQNLVRGAEMITGNLVKPGETFSLLDALAPITLENGYFDAGVIENGEHVEAVGGGLSQMATTTFNAGFFAGYEDVEHHAHSFWFPRYPPGREATIYVGAKDMKFTNDTPYGAVLQSYVAGGELWVKIWSTKHYRVEESNTGKTNVVPTSAIHDSSADCKPYPGGEAGFSIGITRKVYVGNELAKENSFNHTYNPDNPVVCD
ncbi:VanW family protein [Promicromonospora sp. NFX87]|uniref:VanW family protein n=1 Tax=Promicromonospora sp. NFX87 TaxID=3402691 RepID=UPI003AFA5076